jgi:uncharacterized membrane protein
MSTPASIKGHPIHAMLIVFPVGLWIFAMVADLVHLLGWGGPIWRAVALYTIGGGLVGAALAAVFGFVDYRSITNPRVRSIATTHMALNLIVVALFGVSFWLRLSNPLGIVPVVMSGFATLLLGAGGWLGGEMVYVHGVGVSGRDAGPRYAPPRRRAA